MTSFFKQAIRLWNQLPGSVVEADTQDSFTAQLSRAILIYIKKDGPTLDCLNLVDAVFFDEAPYAG
jgi:hypothetical protein